MRDATKTTLSTLLNAESTQVNPLIADSTDETIDFGDAAQAITPPRIGTYWPGQGGIYIGQMLDGNTQIALIMATTAFEGEWGHYGKTIPGEFSYSNGQQNTQLILAAEPENPLLLEITQHQADGHTDFYLPANFEQNLICANAQTHVEKVWHWSSTQHSAHGAGTQGFEDGGQHIGYKGCRYAARAVRRLIIE